MKPLEPNALDRELTAFMVRRCPEGEDREAFRELVLRLHMHLRNQHVCLAIDEDEALDSFSLIGGPEAETPIVHDHGRLYFRRYWRYESALATAIRQRVQALPDSAASGQELAIERAPQTQFLVVSGGPGTGKTHTVANMLAAVLEADATTRIRLAAPTGKAAARLGEVIEAARDQLAEVHHAMLPKQAETLHRLLGMRHGSVLPRFHADNPLPLDLLIVDEVSMVDLALLTKTLAALPDSARVILLGDKDQLESVEAGAVLGEICAAADTDPVLRQHVVLLEKNYRFAEDSGIGELAVAMRAGDADAATDILAEADRNDAAFCTTALEELVETHIRPQHEATTPEEAFAAFERFQFLCATRRGPRGVEAFNIAVALQLGAVPGTFYHGRPILVRENHYTLRLYNGDVGIALEQEDGVVRVAFPDPEHSTGYRWLHPSRLPEHETVYAMTVHKSQGAQFGEVVVVLPDAKSPLLTRELVYTAVTRARQKVSVMGSEAVLKAAIVSAGERHSGLADRLRAD